MFQKIPYNHLNLTSLSGAFGRFNFPSGPTLLGSRDASQGGYVHGGPPPKRNDEDNYSQVPRDNCSMKFYSVIMVIKT
jgi:hypothetical protein